MALDSYVLADSKIDNLSVHFNEEHPQHVVQFTNNITSLNVVSSTQRNDVTYANIGSNVREIQTCAFVGLSGLQAVTGGSN